MPSARPFARLPGLHRLSQLARRFGAAPFAWLGADRTPGPPRMLMAFLALFVCGMVVITLVGDQGLLAYWELRAERERLRVEVARQEARHQALREVVQALRSDPAYIELLARKNLGLVREGEVLVQLPPLERLRETEP